MANGETLAYKHPAIHLVDKSGTLEEAEPSGPGFWQRRALDVGLMTMEKPVTPYWNSTRVTAWVAVIVGFVTVTSIILGAIVSLYIYTRDTSKADGVLIGVQQERERQNSEKILQQDREIERLKTVTGLNPKTPNKKEPTQ